MTREVTIWCDGVDGEKFSCGIWEYIPSEAGGFDKLARLGWKRFKGGRHRCPSCVKELASINEGKTT